MPENTVMTLAVNDPGHSFLTNRLSHATYVHLRTASILFQRTCM